MAFRLQLRRGVASGTKNNYVITAAKDHPRATVCGQLAEHVLIAEMALGHYLPSRAEVHHVDGVRSHNTPSNLVICQDRSYHRLLHVRQAAFQACGQPTWRKCKFCKRYSPVSVLQMGVTRRNGYEPAPYHQQCQTEYRARARRATGQAYHPQKGVFGNQNAKRRKN